MLQNSEILSVNQVAELLGCSKAHVCKAISGKISGVSPLPAISMGRRKLVRRHSLEGWLNQNDRATRSCYSEAVAQTDVVNA